MRIYFDNQAGSASQSIAGLNGLFSYNFGSMSYRRRRSTQVVHLGKAKPDMVTIEAKFQAAINGIVCDTNEFAYINPEQTLRITNTESCSGLSIDEEAGYAIPMKFIAREPVILSTLHQTPTDL